MPSEDNLALLQKDTAVFAKCLELARQMDPVQLERYYGEPCDHCERPVKKSKVDDNPNPLDMLLKVTVSPSFHRLLKYPIVSVEHRNGDGKWIMQPHSLLEMDVYVQRAFQTFGRDFPTGIWTCCAKRCFAMRAILPEHNAVFNVVLKIYRRAEMLHERIESIEEKLQTRKRGVGGSSMVHVSKSRKDRTAEERTDRQKLQHTFKSYIAQVLPYLRGEMAAPDGTLAPENPFCVQSISIVLGVHRNTLYKPVGGHQCVIDRAGVRQRKFRRIGSRKGFKAICELPSFECGCEGPCFTGLNSDVLQRLWDAFKKIAGDLSPEEKEHRFLMNQMFCPLTNTSIRICNAAIAELYTMSVPLVASIRLLVHQMCEDPSIEELPIRKHGLIRYREKNHPMNRFPKEVIECVERHLDMTLRPDPAAADGTNVCRVYSPEINTQEKLRKLLAADVQKDSEEVIISPTTLQRMIRSYLDSRGCKISFSQADHNACPLCKSFQHEILQLHYEEKQLTQKVSFCEQIPRPMTQQDHINFERSAIPLLEERELKRFRSKEAISELRRHSERDARIRGWLKQVTDIFRNLENERRQSTAAIGTLDPSGWCQRRNLALVTHQDDMTKVDLPHVVVDASADITRWRFDLNAHVNAITGDCVLLSHEQGTGPKTASSIIEEVLIDHILTCKGENIKIVVSDNASVGKNWLTTVVFPQYLVDQGLAEIVLVVFLENNHGKWLADMLFGQFQIRKRNSTILSIDGLLQEFERINRPSGGVIRGYAINPLGSVEFAEVFEKLGYETKPPKEIGFKQRNIHFAGACTPEGKRSLAPKLKSLFANALPEEPGVVRICTEPPDVRPSNWREFEDRWVDIPVAKCESSTVRVQQDSSALATMEPPLVVPLNKPFAASGPGVVSKRTAEHVGFNGLSFRGKMSFPELMNEKSILIREAWPSGLPRSGEMGHEFESLRCSPENWFIRKPVRHYGNGSDECKARYPPRNMLNALYCHGPRAAGISLRNEETVYWKPTATYSENPVPYSETLSASEGLRALAAEHRDITQGLNFLDVLRSIYMKMPARTSLSDQWLHEPVTRASSTATDHYKRLLQLLKKRDGVRPTPPLTLLQAFKADEAVQKDIDEAMRLQDEHEWRTREEIATNLFDAHVMRNSPETLVNLRKNLSHYKEEIQNFANRQAGSRAIEREMLAQEKKRSQRRAKAFVKLFERRKLKPGALDRFRRTVEQDKQRHAKELKRYRRELADFDEANNLLALQGPLALYAEDEGCQAHRSES